MFQLRNKKINFLIHTLIKRPENPKYCMSCISLCILIERVSLGQMILLKIKKIIVNFLFKKMVFSRVLWFMKKL